MLRVTLAMVLSLLMPALVIGNSAYQHTSKLHNPKNDATDMTTELGKLGFTVIAGIDLDKAAMEAKIREFARALSASDVGCSMQGTDFRSAG